LPEHFGHVALRYENPNGLRVSFDNSYSGQLFANNANSVKVSDYLVSGLRLGRSIERGKWQYNPYLGLNNLFNASYNNNIRINAFGGRYFEAAPARNLYVGISVRYLGSI
jgi:iron complex outermembrane receptor protein